ncbi:hypothetical protein N8590_03080 [bacterium]|jgi:hypothetical protein|nr:hypothetical protein [bacterium]MDB4793374.1 hypothetical protein [bacterium]
MNDHNAENVDQTLDEPVLMKRWNRMRLIRWSLVALFLLVLLMKNVLADSAFRDGQYYYSAYIAVKQLIIALVLSGGLYALTLLLMPHRFYTETQQGATILARSGANSVLKMRLLAGGAVFAVCCLFLLIRLLVSLMEI